MRWLPYAFLAVTIVIIATVLLAAPETRRGGSPDALVLERAYNVSAEDPADGTVCCTWSDGNLERRCVAVEGRPCSVCDAVCG